ncbi:MAG TPA: helix-turn-helix transcriptional regulator [Rhodanobacter sp.]
MPRAKKSIHKPEFAAVVALLRDVRSRAGLTQVELGQKLGRPQTFVSDCELGIRRLDVLQVQEWCQACGTSLSAFARRLGKDLAILAQK